MLPDLGPTLAGSRDCPEIQFPQEGSFERTNHKDARDRRGTLCRKGPGLGTVADRLPQCVAKKSPRAKAFSRRSCQRSGGRRSQVIAKSHRALGVASFMEPIPILVSERGSLDGMLEDDQSDKDDG